MSMPLYIFHPDPPAEEEVLARQDHWSGQSGWILQLYRIIRAGGVEVQFTQSFDADGTYYFYRDDVEDDDVYPTAKRFLVCFEENRRTHPYSNIDIIQCPIQEDLSGMKKRMYVPLVPQLGLIPRDPERGDRFENLGFYGRASNLAPELQSDEFEQFLNDHGLKLEMHKTAESWADYSTVDCVLAIRELEQDPVNGKPPSKLFNAWAAGVPAIVGREYAFRHYQESDLDYIEVGTVEETKAAIIKLQEDLDLRHRMMGNATKRAPNYTPEKIDAIWFDLFTQQIPSMADEWFNSPGMRRKFMTKQKSYALLRGIKGKVRNLTKSG